MEGMFIPFRDAAPKFPMPLLLAFNWSKLSNLAVMDVGKYSSYLRVMYPIEL